MSVFVNEENKVKKNKQTIILRVHSLIETNVYYAKTE